MGLKQLKYLHYQNNSRLQIQNVFLYQINVPNKAINNKIT